MMQDRAIVVEGD